jgi:hypothetical protein
MANLRSFSNRLNTMSDLKNACLMPPRAAEGLDVGALLREVGKNQDEVEKTSYGVAFTSKRNRS